MDSTMKNRTCSLFKSLTFLFLISIALQTPALAQNNSVRFLVISDWGGYASNDQKAVAVAMNNEAKDINAQFVVTAGDNFHGEGIDSAHSSRWKSEFEDIYDGKYLNIPWYPCLGNHDNRGNAEAEIEYSNYSTRWKFPSRYYVQEEKAGDSLTVLIVHLDTSPFISDYHTSKDNYHVRKLNPDVQLHWLDSVLSHSKAFWKIVVGHHPVYSAAGAHGDQQDMIERVLPLLQKYKVQAYMNGHDHTLQHIRNAGMNFFICGGGAHMRDVFDREDVIFGKKSLGFLSVTIGKEEMRVKFINSENKLLHSAVIIR